MRAHTPTPPGEHPRRTPRGSAGSRREAAPPLFTMSTLGRLPSTQTAVLPRFGRDIESTLFASLEEELQRRSDKAPFETRVGPTTGTQADALMPAARRRRRAHSYQNGSAPVQAAAAVIAARIGRPLSAEAPIEAAARIIRNDVALASVDAGHRGGSQPLARARVGPAYGRYRPMAEYIASSDGSDAAASSGRPNSASPDVTLVNDERGLPYTRGRGPYVSAEMSSLVRSLSAGLERPPRASSSPRCDTPDDGFFDADSDDAVMGSLARALARHGPIAHPPLDERGSAAAAAAMYRTSLLAHSAPPPAAFSTARPVLGPPAHHPRRPQTSGPTRLNGRRVSERIGQWSSMRAAMSALLHTGLTGTGLDERLAAAADVYGGSPCGRSPDAASSLYERGRTSHGSSTSRRTSCPVGPPAGTTVPRPFHALTRPGRQCVCCVASLPHAFAVLSVSPDGGSGRRRGPRVRHGWSDEGRPTSSPRTPRPISSASGRAHSDGHMAHPRKPTGTPAGYRSRARASAEAAGRSRVARSTPVSANHARVPRRESPPRTPASDTRSRSSGAFRPSVSGRSRERGGVGNGRAPAQRDASTSPLTPSTPSRLDDHTEADEATSTSPLQLLSSATMRPSLVGDSLTDPVSHTLPTSHGHPDASMAGPANRPGDGVGRKAHEEAGVVTVPALSDNLLTSLHVTAPTASDGWGVSRAAGSDRLPIPAFELHIHVTNTPDGPAPVALSSKSSRGAASGGTSLTSRRSASTLSIPEAASTQAGDGRQTAEVRPSSASRVRPVGVSVDRLAERDMCSMESELPMTLSVEEVAAGTGDSTEESALLTMTGAARAGAVSPPLAGASDTPPASSAALLETVARGQRVLFHTLEGERRRDVEERESDAWERLMSRARPAPASGTRSASPSPPGSASAAAEVTEAAGRPSPPHAAGEHHMGGTVPWIVGSLETHFRRLIAEKERATWRAMVGPALRTAEAACRGAVEREARASWEAAYTALRVHVEQARLSALCDEECLERERIARDEAAACDDGIRRQTESLTRARRLAETRLAESLASIRRRLEEQVLAEAQVRRIIERTERTIRAELEGLIVGFDEAACRRTMVEEEEQERCGVHTQAEEAHFNLSLAHTPRADADAGASVEDSSSDPSGAGEMHGVPTAHPVMDKSTTGEGSSPPTSVATTPAVRQPAPALLSVDAQTTAERALLSGSHVPGGVAPTSRPLSPLPVAGALQIGSSTVTMVPAHRDAVGEGRTDSTKPAPPFSISPAPPGSVKQPLTVSMDSPELSAVCAVSEDSTASGRSPAGAYAHRRRATGRTTRALRVSEVEEDVFGEYRELDEGTDCEEADGDDGRAAPTRDVVVPDHYPVTEEEEARAVGGSTDPLASTGLPIRETAGEQGPGSVDVAAASTSTTMIHSATDRYEQRAGTEELGSDEAYESSSELDELDPAHGAGESAMAPAEDGRAAHALGENRQSGSFGEDPRRRSASGQWSSLPSNASSALPAQALQRKEEFVRGEHVANVQLDGRDPQSALLPSLGSHEPLEQTPRSASSSTQEEYFDTRGFVAPPSKLHGSIGESTMSYMQSIDRSVFSPVVARASRLPVKVGGGTRGGGPGDHKASDSFEGSSDSDAEDGLWESPPMGPAPEPVDSPAPQQLLSGKHVPVASSAGESTLGCRSGDGRARVVLLHQRSDSVSADEAEEESGGSVNHSPVPVESLRRSPEVGENLGVCIRPVTPPFVRAAAQNGDGSVRLVGIQVARGALQRDEVDDGHPTLAGGELTREPETGATADEARGTPVKDSRAAASAGASQYEELDDDTGAGAGDYAPMAAILDVSELSMGSEELEEAPLLASVPIELV